jgi:hypothetical protein
VPSFSSQVNASTDDGDYAVVSGTNFQATATDMRLGDVSGVEFGGWVRVVLNVPQGATITDAIITFISNLTNSSTTNLVITAEAADNPSAPTTAADARGRTRTTASVNWSPAAQTSGSSYDTPDIKTIIQEIVNRAGWVSGNRILLFIDSNGSNATSARREVRTYNYTGNVSGPVVSGNYTTLTAGTIAVSSRDHDSANMGETVAPSGGTAPISRMWQENRNGDGWQDIGYTVSTAIGSGLQGDVVLYRVRYTDAASQVAYSNELSVSYYGSVTVSNPVRDDSTETSITVSWPAPTGGSGSFTIDLLWKHVSSGTWNEVLNTTSPQLISGLSSASQYQFAVRVNDTITTVSTTSGVTSIYTKGPAQSRFFTVPSFTVAVPASLAWQSPVSRSFTAPSFEVAVPATVARTPGNVSPTFTAPSFTVAAPSVTATGGAVSVGATAPGFDFVAVAATAVPGGLDAAVIAPGIDFVAPDVSGEIGGGSSPVIAPGFEVGTPEFVSFAGGPSGVTVLAPGFDFVAPDVTAEGGPAEAIAVAPGFEVLAPGQLSAVWDQVVAVSAPRLDFWPGERTGGMSFTPEKGATILSIDGIPTIGIEFTVVPTVQLSMRSDL